MSRVQSRRFALGSTEVILGTVLILFILIALILRPTPLARGSVDDPENPEPRGMMAVSEVLQSQGVKVKVARTVSAALRSSSTQLIITRADRLSSEQLEELAALNLDTVIIGASRSVAGFAPDLQRVTFSPETKTAGCDDPRLSAGGISTNGPTLASPQAQACFPGPDEGAVLTWQSQGRQITFAPSDIFHNSSILEESNAAIALSLLSQGESTTWLIGDHSDTSGWNKQPADPFDLSWMMAAILGTLIALIWAYGPRFGRLISEPLPVIVNASETTVGRGHLYRQSKDLGHSARALRLAAITAIAPALGLHPRAGSQEVVAQVAAASSRSTEQVQEILYGPAPVDNDSLHALALSLDALVNEVEHT